jgi:GT2 family glycosyltransferase
MSKRKNRGATVANDSSDAATVVVCTRNRGDKIVATIVSVLEGKRNDVDVLVIDQSDNDETRDAVAPFVTNGRVRYIRSTETGVSRSRTMSLHEAKTEFVLNTDDDCIVDPDWVGANVRALVANPDAAIVFGDVIAPFDSGGGYAPESVAESDFVVGSIWRWKPTDGVNVGIGASMAMRRSMLLDLGGFDVELGPGSDLRNAEDTDMTLRALLAGHTIVRTRQAKVDHYGHRSHDEFRSLTRGAMLGLGAAAGKLIRRKPLAATWFLCGLLWRMVVKVTIVDLAHLRRPPVLGRAIYIAKGFWRGLRKPLQPGAHVLFVETRA